MTTPEICFKIIWGGWKEGGGGVNDRWDWLAADWGLIVTFPLLFSALESSDNKKFKNCGMPI